jgi:DNA-binding FadR family transcriptional regulator
VWFGYLPAKTELEEKFRVRRTVHEAVDTLGKQRFTYITQGKATKILDCKAGHANCENLKNELGLCRSHHLDDHLSDFQVGRRC